MVELKCVLMVHGELYAVTTGITLMLVLLASSWDIHLMVCHQMSLYVNHEYLKFFATSHEYFLL